MSPKWHRLHLSDQSLPPLLFQWTWNQQGYEVYLTDLTYIWSERLPQKQIIRRAEENATTIDPGEDPDQFPVLLEKIGEALRKGKNSAMLGRGTQPDSLEIKTTTKLPAPLKPLKWDLKLSKESSSYLTSTMLLPLLTEEANREQRQRYLLQQIKQKDTVLSKLLDKIETVGIDLGSIFPSAAGSRGSRKGITRSEAGRLIKGIEPFEEQTWLAEARSSETAGLATNLLEEISGSTELYDLSAFDQPRDKWWPQLTEFPTSSVREASQTSEELPMSDQKDDAAVLPGHLETEGHLTESSDDGEFQRQETPPRLRSEPTKNESPPPRQEPKEKDPSPSPLPSEAEDEATASDSEPEPEPRPKPRSKAVQDPALTTSKKPPTPPPQEEPKKKKGGLGVIGGKKFKEKEPPALRQARDSPESQPQEVQNSPEEIAKDDHPPTSRDLPGAANKAKRLGKLGMIGGKAKAKAKEPVRHASSPPASETLAKSPDQGSPAKPQDITDKVAKKEKSPLPALPAVEKPPPAEPETDDQRADRRREELKRTLEAQSKAPAKKKRRF